MAPVLDDPVRSSLEGAHAHLAERHGRAVRYPREVGPFQAPPREPAEWDDVAALVGAGRGTVIPTLAPLDPPPGWEVTWSLAGVQLVGEDVTGRADPSALVLGPDDVAEMSALVRRTEPGPFGPRTIEMGTYLGVREGGHLVAMAGERFRPAGYTEISAVCTDPSHRGRGLATRLVLDLVTRIRARGEVPMLHASAANTTAIRLYEQLGFRLRARPDFVLVTVPAEQPART